MTQEITRSFDIDCGHRLIRHESKCRNPHGHRYTIEVTCYAFGLDDVGRVIDFGLIKEKVKGWLDEVFDHGFIFQDGDPLIDIFRAHDFKTVVLDCPPSIENLSEVWFNGAADILAPLGVVVSKLRAYETATCWAEYTARDRSNARTMAAARSEAQESAEKLLRG